MKRKALMSLITAVLTMAISTTIAVALLNVSKLTSTITIQTTGVDVGIAAPILENYTSLSPGQTFTVSVRVTNSNRFPVVVSGVSLQNITWYNENSLMNDPQPNLSITNTTILDSQGNTIINIAPGSFGYLKVTAQLPLDPEYANKTVRFNIKMDFSEQT